MTTREARAIEHVAQALHRDHPNLLYLADARLVAKTAVDALRGWAEVHYPSMEKTDALQK